MSFLDLLRFETKQNTSKVFFILYVGGRTIIFFKNNKKKIM